MERYVADTHALVWYLGGSSRLSQPAREALDSVGDGRNEVIVPAIWLNSLICTTA